MKPIDKINLRDNYVLSDWIVPNRINLGLRVCGISLIVIGLGTWFIPFTTLPLISSGLLLCGVTLKQVQQQINLIKYKLRNRILLRTLRTKLLLIR